MINVKLDSQKCISCGYCIDVCPNQVFASESPADNDKRVFVRRAEFCITCGHCAAICPEDAIILANMDVKQIETLPEINFTHDDLNNLLMKRRSIRAYKDKPVANDMIEKLIEAATHAGTSSHGQTENFIVIRNRNILNKLEDLVVKALWNAGLKYIGNALGRAFIKLKHGPAMVQHYKRYYDRFSPRIKSGDIRGMILRNAPALIIMHGLKMNFLARSNCAIATRNMEILALTMDLGSCWVGYLPIAASKSKKINEFLEIPDGRAIYSGLMVGYPKHDYNKKIPRKAREVRWIE